MSPFTSRRALDILGAPERQGQRGSTSGKMQHLDCPPQQPPTSCLHCAHSPGPLCGHICQEGWRARAGGASREAHSSSRGVSGGPRGTRGHSTFLPNFRCLCSGFRTPLFTPLLTGTCPALGCVTVGQTAGHWGWSVLRSGPELGIRPFDGCHWSWPCAVPVAVICEGHHLPGW